MTVRFYLVALTVMLYSLAIIISIPVYAQEGNNSMIVTTSKGSLDIQLEPIESSTPEVKYKVSFLNPGTETLHQHQDYDFKILRDGQQLFSAAATVNQPLIHNVEGSITVPYTFQQGGDYSIQVDILGLGFGPTLVPTDESAVFQVVVTPEFPTGAAIAVAALVGITITLTRKFMPH